ncbi:MAG: membrane protein insertase YidC [Nitrospiraceae bacterium]|nr:MAG: membrane protein insertase YidC [Nitrospiraceae bacterium]
MEKRTILAVVLSVSILLIWSYLFPTKQAPQRPAPLPEQQAPVQTDTPTQAPPVHQPPSIPVQPIAPAYGEGEEVTVETDLYRAVFSTRGAIVTSWELKEYDDKNGNPVSLLRARGVVPSLGILFEDENRNLPQQLIFSSSAESLILSQEGKQSGEIVFSYNENGIAISKRFVFYNDDYKVDLSLKTQNTPSYMLPIGTDFGVYNKDQREHKGPILLIDTDKETFDDGMESPEYFTGNIGWIAQEDNYFAAALIPVTPYEGVSVWKERAAAEIAFKLKPQDHNFIFYAGPKEYDRLEKLNSGLEHIVDFGWFTVVALPLFLVLKFFYSFLGNYGWAIVLLTIVTRVPFIPILMKSQKSMKKMQKVQPLMAEIKEKYKKDAAKMQKEMTALYKKHKVNPIGGCLPMFLQIPVFIALFNVLQKAIELRGAPFVLWITDLSVKDPYYVLPIVMGATMVLQQKMTPSAMDPKQAKMMMLMPIVFTFMFLSFSSGLVLYWLVNNILGIAQQFYANKKAD